MGCLEKLKNKFSNLNILEIERLKNNEQIDYIRCNHIRYIKYF